MFNKTLLAINNIAKLLTEDPNVFNTPILEGRRTESQNLNESYEGLPDEDHFGSGYDIGDDVWIVDHSNAYAVKAEVIGYVDVSRNSSLFSTDDAVERWENGERSNDPGNAGIDSYIIMRTLMGAEWATIAWISSVMTGSSHDPDLETAEWVPPPDYDTDPFGD